jgi:hypothetical protein
MTGFAGEFPVDRRALLAGAAGLAGSLALGWAQPAAATPGTGDPTAGAADTAGGDAASARYPANWPDPEPYGVADTRPDLWPRDDNSFVLPLELRPRDQERGQVWIRDTYVNCFVVDGRPVYVATGTTRSPGLPAAGPWNDGIFLWVAPSLHGPWKLADTTGFRPDAEKGKVWSPEFVGENRRCTTSAAPGTSSRAWATTPARSGRSCW